MFKFIYLGTDRHQLAGVGWIDPGVPFETSSVQAAYLECYAADSYRALPLDEAEANAVIAEVVANMQRKK